MVSFFFSTYFATICNYMMPLLTGICDLVPTLYKFYIIESVLQKV